MLVMVSAVRGALRDPNFQRFVVDLTGFVDTNVGVSGCFELDGLTTFPVTLLTQTGLV